MDSPDQLAENGVASRVQSFNRGVNVDSRLFIALPLLMLAAGCVANGPRPAARAGGAYVEEIKSPMPRDTLLLNPNCLVR